MHAGPDTAAVPARVLPPHLFPPSATWGPSSGAAAAAPDQPPPLARVLDPGPRVGEHCQHRQRDAENQRSSQAV